MSVDAHRYRWMKVGWNEEPLSEKPAQPAQWGNGDSHSVVVLTEILGADWTEDMRAQFRPTRSASSMPSDFLDHFPPLPFSHLRRSGRRSLRDLQSSATRAPNPHLREGPVLPRRFVGLVQRH